MADAAGNAPLIAVIGAGISGLSTAYYLKSRGYGVIVLERDTCVGGTMRTLRKDGYLIDTGPNSALETVPLIRETLAEIGLEKEQVYANPVSNNRYIVRAGKLHALPMNPVSFLLTPLFSGRAKLRLFKEPFIAPLPAGRHESVADFVERRLGREFLDYAINPFIAGVYAGNPKQLSVAHSVPKVFQLEQKYGSLIRGAIRGLRERKKRKETSKHKARLFAFREGMDEFPRGLAAVLGDAVITGASVGDIRRQPGNGNKFTIRYRLDGAERDLAADGVYFAVPSYELAGYLGSFSPPAPDALRSIPYARVAMVFIGADRRDCSHPLDGFGFLVPEAEKRSILGTIWSSSIFPERAPEGKIALTTFVGGARQPELCDLDDNRLTDLVLGELKSLIGLSPSPEIVYVRKWEKAIPQYVMGYERVLRTLEEFERDNPGMFIGGNFRNGIGVGDCVRQAYESAEKIDAHFTGGTAEGNSFFA